MSVGRVGGALGLKLDGSSGVVSFPIDGRLKSRVHGQVPAGRVAALPQVGFPMQNPWPADDSGKTAPPMCRASG